MFHVKKLYFWTQYHINQMQTTQLFHNHKFRFLLIVIVLLFTACAQIVAPTGGARDTTPPKIVKVFPLANTLNFNQNMEIKITFDEFMEVVNPSEKTMISPPLKYTPTYKTEGKSLIIKLNDTLKENTTYTLFFDNCIRDITENNTLSSFEYVFSTGKVIDSNSIKGSVIDALTLKPEKQVYVMLYKENIDSLPQTQKPYYITKTNDQGEFTFAHISQGLFKIFTLVDKNNNLIFDQFTERIGFANNTISSKSEEPIKMSMFSQADTAQRLLRTAVMTKGKFYISLKKEVSNFSIKMNKGSFNDRFITEIGKNKDTLYLYDKYFLPDTVTLFLSDQNMLDTITISPSLEKKTSRKIGTDVATKVYINLLNERELYDTLKLLSSFPIKAINKERISLYKLGKDTTLVPFTITSDDQVNKLYSITYQKNELESFLLRILDSTFIGYNNLINDTIISSFTILSENDYGNLQILLDNKKNLPLIVQLLNDKGTVLAEMKCENSTKISWKNLVPGSYQVRAIVDENRNMKWDSGDYFNKKQPERILFFATPIQIRAKWDIEEKFVID